MQDRWRDADAKAYLRELVSSEHGYHLDDDASDIVVGRTTGELVFSI